MQGSYLRLISIPPKQVSTSIIYIETEYAHYAFRECIQNDPKSYRAHIYQYVLNTKMYPSKSKRRSLKRFVQFFDKKVFIAEMNDNPAERIG